MALPIIIPIAIRLAMILGGITAAALGVGKFTKESEKNYFNRGVCKKCGGHFKVIPGTEVKGSKGYKCDVCDNCVWVDFGADDGYIYTPSKHTQK